MNGGYPQPKAVLFDVGSTLIRPYPGVAHEFTRVAQERGHTLALADVEPHMAAVEAYYEAEYLRDGDFWCSHERSVGIWYDQYRYLCHLTGIQYDADGMAWAVHAAYGRPDCWQIYPDVIACLRGLKEQGMLLGVVSNWDAELESLLRSLRLLPFFDTVIASAAVGYRKPNPIIFDLALESLQMRPEEVIHVGDHPEADGGGASAAGIYPLIIDRSCAQVECGFKTITSLAEVLVVCKSEKQ